MTEGYKMYAQAQWERGRWSRNSVFRESKGERRQHIYYMHKKYLLFHQLKIQILTFPSMSKLLWLSFSMPMLTGKSGFILGSLRTQGIRHPPRNHNSWPSVSVRFTSAPSTNHVLNILEKKLHQVPNTKPWICYASTTIYIAFTLYLLPFT